MLFQTMDEAARAAIMAPAMSEAPLSAGRRGSTTWSGLHMGNQAVCNPFHMLQLVCDMQMQDVGLGTHVRDSVQDKLVADCSLPKLLATSVRAKPRV